MIERFEMEGDKNDSTGSIKKFQNYLVAIVHIRGIFNQIHCTTFHQSVF